MSKALATKSPVSERMRSIQRVLWIILALNLAVAAAKYVWGAVSGSESMQPTASIRCSIRRATWWGLWASR